MAKVPDKDLTGYLESARDMANGTLLMSVVVEDHQMATAQDWIKGKRKVKNLTLISRSDHDKSREAREAKLIAGRKALRKKAESSK